MSKFTSSHVIDIEFDVDDAVHILSDPSPKQALQDYLVSRHGIAAKTYAGSYNADELAKALGKHLAERRIAEAKQLPVSTGGAS